MKPEGRALDIAVVGLGQAGGNLASEFSRRGYRALVFNTGETDLAALGPNGLYPQLPGDRRLYIGLAGYDGAGADPDYGAECLLEHADRVRGAILDLAAEADVLVLAAGLGGGTGSALPTLIELMKGTHLPMVALATLPTAGESGISKVNAVRAIGELLEAQLLGWIFIDNARITELKNDLPVASYFTRINADIVAPLDALNRLNDRGNLKAIRSFDGEDFRRLLLSGGFLNYAVTELSSITVPGVLDAVRSAVRDSLLMPAGFEVPRLSSVGLVLEAPEAVLARTPITTFEQIQEQLKLETGGAALYQGLYRANEGEPVLLRLIAATQALPRRVVDLVSAARREGSALTEKVREAMPVLDLSDVDGFELFRTTPPNRPSERPRPSSSRPEVALGTEPPASEPLPIPLPADEPSAPPSPNPNLNPSSSSASEPPPERPRSDPLGGRSADPRLLRRRLSRPREGSQVQLRGESRARTPSTKAASDGETDQEEEGSNRRESSSERALAVGVVPDEMLGIGHPTQTNIQLRRELLDRTRQNAKPEPTASSEEYARFVSDFQEAENQRVKDEIIRRLQQDSVSEHKVVRYHAVEAMARIGRGVFASALLAATEDDDEGVRTLAKEALRR